MGIPIHILFPYSMYYKNKNEEIHALTPKRPPYAQKIIIHKKIVVV